MWDVLLRQGCFILKSKDNTTTRKTDLYSSYINFFFFFLTLIMFLCLNYELLKLLVNKLKDSEMALRDNGLKSFAVFSLLLLNKQKK